MQETDKELLELAAKAAGYVGEWKYLEAFNGRIAGWYFVLADHSVFNPLKDDGDALRLAVKLEIDLQHNWGSVIAIYTRNDSVKIGVPSHAEVGGDEYKDRLVATRRAIVRAAAEIGRNMK